MATSKNFLARALVGFAVLTSVGMAMVAPTRADWGDYRHHNWRHHEWREHAWREHNHWRWGYYGYRPYTYYGYYLPYDRSYYYEH